jgi:hypothetical protein
MEDVLRIDGVYYDTRALSKLHPGGETFVAVSNRTDATAIFRSSYRRRFPHEKYQHLQVPESCVAKHCRLPEYSQSFFIVQESKARPSLEVHWKYERFKPQGSRSDQGAVICGGRRPRRTS